MMAGMKTELPLLSKKDRPTLSVNIIYVFVIYIMIISNVRMILTSDFLIVNILRTSSQRILYKKISN